MASVNATQIPGYLPQWDDRMDMNSGFIPISDSDSLFFWSFHAKKDNSTTESPRPLVIWLNGGPGCSSMDGALMEIGPLRVTDDASVKWNMGWFERADLLFIDQPIGTGFSFSSSHSLDSSLSESSQHLITFLTNYFQTFPDQFQHYNSYIIAGESYAGQYIPHLANLMIDIPEFQDKLKAIMLGNAWLDPPLQSLSYIPYAIDNGIIDISSPEQERKITALMQLQQDCQNNQDTANAENLTCDNILLKLLSAYRKNNKCINVYDIKKSDSYPSCGNNWPEILTPTTSFLNSPHVKSALHVMDDSSMWKECNNDVHSHFTTDNDKTGAELLNNILNNGIKVNIFSGVDDLICNYLGSELVIKHHTSEYLTSNNLSITHEKREIEKFQMDNDWFHNDKLSGSIWSRGNLSYVQIYNASHMVPYDLSETSIGLLDITLNNANDTHTYTGSETPSPAPTPPSSTRKPVALVLLLLIFGLIIWCFYTIWQGKRKAKYSALAVKRKNTYSRYAYEWMSGTKGKKKVHWIDLEDGGEFDVEDENELEDFSVEGAEGDENEESAEREEGHA